MESLRIGTWDIANHFFCLSRNSKKVSSIVRLLSNFNLDILTLQEVSPILIKRIERELCSLGLAYRITSIYSKNYSPIKNLRTKYNIIISNMTPFVNSNTISLVSKPRNIKKIQFRENCNQSITLQILEDNIIVNVAHLGFLSNELGQSQIEEVIHILNSQKLAGRDVIFTGGLSKEMVEHGIIDFSGQLLENGMHVVEGFSKKDVGTQNERSINYIAMSKDWQIESVETLEDYADVSISYPTVVAVRKIKK